MVRVISVHHFDNQIIQTCDEPLAIATAPPDRLLIALPHHVVEVKDLTGNGETVFSFPTVDQVCYLEHSVTGARPLCRPTSNHQFFSKLYNSVRREKIESKISKHASKILDHFSTSNFFDVEKANIDYKLIQKEVKNPEAIYIMDPDVAKKMISAVKEDLRDYCGVVFEANPGLGLLTKELMNADIKNLYAFETDDSFKNRICMLQDQYPERLKVVGSNILNIWKLAYQDRMDNGSRVETLMQDVQKKFWGQEPAIKMFATLPNFKFIKHIVSNLVLQNGFVSYGRPEFYVVLNPQTYVQILFNKDLPKVSNKPSTVFLECFFDINYLCSLDRKSFLPWQSSSNPKLNVICDKYHLNPEEFYFVKLSPKALVTEKIPIPFLKPFWFFLNRQLRSRKNRVISEMEKWVPGCGPRLISRRIGLFTEFADLSSSQLLDLFIDFTQWPEFESCPFLAALEARDLLIDGVEE